MLNRTLLIAAASAVLLVGCSGSPKITQVPPKASSSSEATTEETSSEQAAGSASEPLDSEQCLEVSEAHLDIIVASDAAEATPPAEKLKAYDPPDSVIEAIDHFVETGGIQFDDPDATTFTDELDSWIAEVCPS